MNFSDYQKWFDRLPFARQMDMQRRAGFSVADPEFSQLLARAAERVGLTRTATPVEVLYASQYGAIGCPCQEGHVGAEKDEGSRQLKSGCVAENFPTYLIHTDPERFQNRQDAFSELSAESVAKHFDPNKFDPLVVWADPVQRKVFVLSGHSRLEGMKRRKAAYVPVRQFRGTEAEAIQFARVDANRANNGESLVEDLKAYKLMRDGDPARNLKPAKKSELARVFKGKQAKLEAWSHLTAGGLFLDTLSQENRTEFPYLEKFALWVGQLRAKHPEMSNTHEADCFNFFYADAKNQRVNREDFDQLISKRLAWGKPRLFPECDRGGCVNLQDLTKRGPQADTYKMLEALSKYRETITSRLRTTDRSLRIYTDEERAKLKEQGQLIDMEMQRLRKDLGQAEAAPGLFGPPAKGRQYVWPALHDVVTIDGLKGGAVVQPEVMDEMNVPEIKISYRKRRFGPARHLSTAADVADLFREIWDQNSLDVQESVYVLYMTGSGVLLGYYRHTIGTPDSAQVDKRLILAGALKSLARMIFVAHNHPSGVLTASDADKAFTKDLQRAGETVGVSLLDSLIITRTGYTSLYDMGLIN